MLQGAALGSCQVSVTVYCSMEQLEFTEQAELLEQHAEQVARISARLQERYGTQICITLRAARNAPLAPTPSVMQHLAPFLHHMDYYIIPDQHIYNRSQLSAFSQSKMTMSHVQALQQAATSLQSLCMAICHQDIAHSTLLSRPCPLSHI